MAINAAMKLAETDASPVPLHLRNGVTKLMRNEGYGAGYKYPHNFPEAWVQQQYLPDLFAVRRIPRHHKPGFYPVHKPIGLTSSSPFTYSPQLGIHRRGF